MDETCVNCGRPIRRINYALGPEWMHVDRNASWHSEQRGTAWRYCRQNVATPRTTTEQPDGAHDEGDEA